MLVAGDVEGFNASRGERRKIDFFAAELANVQIPGVDLSQVQLQKADLTEADLSGAVLFKADLSDIDGTSINLKQVLAVRASFRDAWLEEADLSEGDFSQARFAEANLVRSNATGCRLIGAKLKEIDASSGIWVEADLSEASLYKATFTDADLRRVDFSEVSGAEANFDGATLDDALGKDARFRGASMKNASLVGARFPGADFADVDFSGADLSRVDFSSANLAGATLTGATLTGANLSNACLDEVDLTDLDLAGVDFSGLDPMVLNLSKAQLKTVGAVGASVEQDAPVFFSDITLAQGDGRVLIVWKNQDSDVSHSMRWVLMDDEDVFKMGILPISSQGVISYTAIAQGDDFSVAVISERPGGVVLLLYGLSKEGERGPVRTLPLGYQPGVPPMLRSIDGDLWLWGLARRGPALMVHRLADEGLELVATERHPTARGLLGRRHPVLWCKSEVVMPVTTSGTQAPLRTPAGFGGRLALAVPLGSDGVALVWVAPFEDLDHRGGLRATWLAPKTPADIVPIGSNPHVISLDALAIDDDCLLAWIEVDDDGEIQVMVRKLPEGESVSLGLDVGVEGDRYRQVRLAVGKQGPMISLTSTQGGVEIHKLADHL